MLNTDDKFEVNSNSLGVGTQGGYNTYSQEMVIYECSQQGENEISNCDNLKDLN